MIVSCVLRPGSFMVMQRTSGSISRHANKQMQHRIYIFDISDCHISSWSAELKWTVQNGENADIALVAIGNDRKSPDLASFKTLRQISHGQWVSVVGLLFDQLAVGTWQSTSVRVVKALVDCHWCWVCIVPVERLMRSAEFQGHIYVIYTSIFCNI